MNVHLLYVESFVLDAKSLYKILKTNYTILYVIIVYINMKTNYMVMTYHYVFIIYTILLFIIIIPETNANVSTLLRQNTPVHKKLDTFEDDKLALHEELNKQVVQLEQDDKEKTAKEDKELDLPPMIKINRPNISKLMGILHSTNNKLLPHLFHPNPSEGAAKKLYNEARIAHYDAVEEILQNNKKLNADKYKDKNGWTALSWAAHHGKANMVKLLVQKGKANINHVSHNKHMSVLMLACMMGELHTVDTIIQLGGNVNAISSINATPLIYATSTQNHEVMKLLLKHGADKDMKAKNGKNAMMIAKGKGDQIAMKILS